MIAAAELDETAGVSNTHAVVRAFGTWNVLATFETVGPAANVFFSPDGERLATSTMTGWVQLWDLRSRKEISRTRVSDLSVYHLQFSADGASLATSGNDRIGRVYDVTGSQLTLRQTFRDAGLLSMSPDKTRIAAWLAPREHGLSEDRVVAAGLGRSVLQAAGGHHGAPAEDHVRLRE